MFFSSLSFAKSGLYTQILAPAIGVSGGIKMNSVGIELTAKCFSLNNQAIGDSDYSSKLKNFTFSGGIRLFIQNRFSFKVGAIFHNLEVDVLKTI